MKIKVKLSLLVITIMAVVVTGIAGLLLRRASQISLDLSMRGLEFMAGKQAEFWKSMEDGHVRALHTLANLLSKYKSIPREERRDLYDNMLKSALESEPDMLALYMVWKPNAIDGMDKRYIGRAGSSPAGQYAITYTRETGQIKARTSDDIKKLMAHITGPDARKDRVDNPSPRMVNGKETLTFILSVPIIDDITGEVVGGVGCVLSINVIQRQIMNTIETNEVIDMAVMYSGNGTILAHFIPGRIGKKIFDVDVELGDSLPAVYAAIQNGTTFRDIKYDPTLDVNIGFVMKPFQIGNSDHNLAILIGSSESYIFKEVKAITRYTIVLAALALTVSAIIIYIVLNRVTKPIVKAVETLKDISEGEWDLTRTIKEHGNDEIADLARYFNETLEKIRHLIVTIKGQTVKLSGIGGELTGNMTETASAINEIASNINKLKGHVEEQISSMSRSSSAVDVIQESKSLELVTQEITGGMNEMAAGAEQINTAVTRVNAISGKTKENIDILAREVSRFKVA
jgi:methyl-accepting chemotaxis protein